jgi:hypothetical protein
MILFDLYSDPNNVCAMYCPYPDQNCELCKAQRPPDDYEFEDKDLPPVHSERPVNHKI